MKAENDPHDLQGLVFNIQRFSVHDGTGIRTTVFMKGCPLSCRWCSNPESQDFESQLMVRDAVCTGCGNCVVVCPQRAIRINVKGNREIDWERCDQCLVCVEACLYQALQHCGTPMGVDEVFEEVVRDRPFYKNSGGGITISGGEPMLQAEFVVRLLGVCKSEGLHTAVDTTGYAAWSRIRAVAACTDLLLWDVKHLDPRIHETHTGVGNRLILENLKRATELTNIWLRVPLIAGFNDSVEHIEAVASLALEIGAQKISLLPYHEGGRSKTDQIGGFYQFPGARAPAEDHVEQLRKRIEALGMTVGIGN